MYRVHIELVDGLSLTVEVKILPYNVDLPIIAKMLAPGREQWMYDSVQAILIEKGEEDASKTTAKDV